MDKPYRSNAVKGKRGFQSLLTGTQQSQLLRIWVQNDWKNAPVRKFLSDNYELELRDRTLRYYKRRLRTRWDMVSSEIDEPVDWADFVTLARHGIPDQHLRKLHEMWQEIQKACIDSGAIAIEPTYRNLKWWAFMLEYYSDTIEQIGDLQMIAEQYAVRELMAEFDGTGVDRKDLDMWLLYHPWTDEQGMAKYVSDIETEAIPGLDLSKYGWGIEIAYVANVDEYAFKGLYLASLNAFLAESPEPYLLPSQIMDDYLPEIMDKIQTRHSSEGGQPDSQ